MSAPEFCNITGKCNRKPAPSAEAEEGADPDPYFCVCCELVDVTQCDADRCCLGCGYDLWPLSQVRELLSRAGLAIVPAADVPTPEERQVLEACAAAEVVMLSNGWRMLDGNSNRSVVEAELARRAARKEKP